MNKEMITPEELEIALLWADAEFRVHYYYQFDPEPTDWTLQVRRECKEFAAHAVIALRQGNIQAAIQELQYAHALEGDFCGWVDFRVYASPLKLLKGK